MDVGFVFSDHENAGQFKNNRPKYNRYQVGIDVSSRNNRPYIVTTVPRKNNRPKEIKAKKDLWL